MKKEFIKKCYDPSTHLFVVKWVDQRTCDIKGKTFKSFAGFASFLKGDWDKANLQDYDFEGVDLTHYAMKGAILSPNVLKKYGRYDDSWAKLLHHSNSLAIATLSPGPSLPIPRYDSQAPTNCSFRGENAVNDVYYISDLHLDYKLAHKFPGDVTEAQLRHYFRSIAWKLHRSMNQKSYGDYCVFAGDITNNFSIFKLFFEEIKGSFLFSKIVIVLGNHELWDPSFETSHFTFDQIVKEYRSFCRTQGFIFLQNDLWVCDNEAKTFHEKQLLEMSDEELKEATRSSRFLIFGGMGFSGKNEEFNANSGIYGPTLIDRKEEIKQSERIDALYRRLLAAIPNRHVIVVTHMPKEDWTEAPYQSGWVYLWGHNHRNFFLEDEAKTVYADNQLGYSSEAFAFRYFSTEHKANIFIDKADGIYEVGSNDIIDFYRHLGVQAQITRTYQKLFLLKRDGAYCFLGIMPEGDLRFLNGGQPKKVGDHDVTYYYDHLGPYAASVRLFLKDYQEHLKAISAEIKRFGGAGSIHGCIVDIDYFNHVYLNPLDGTITAYYADSITSKMVYPNLVSLLKQSVPNLYPIYLRQNAQYPLAIFGQDKEIESEPVFVEDTKMYHISRVIKGLQYTANYNVVRVWNDTLLSSASLTSGKEIVESIIYPELEKPTKE
ncbi:MAG: hypothetical protein BWZ03_00167 [bacterium ADurb.BinA186]|jgi:hypothetical protein|nr:MAG: hypothetical protein BWZ03_00167 [bacterium ADurb.BinA186]